MNYIILRDFMSKADCNLLQDSYLMPNVSVELPLIDGDDKANVSYKSKRSPNLYYKYLKNKDSDRVSDSMKKKLSDLLNVSFEGSINDYCLPLFCYGDGGSIKAHRGVQKTKDLKKYQSYVAVCQLTQRGKDFQGGRFYINEKALCSEDGKTVTNDFKQDRFYPMLNKGDVCVFFNPLVVHGVETVKAMDNGMAFRLTCSFRSNKLQKTI